MFLPMLIHINDDQSAQVHLLTPQTIIDAVGPNLDPALFVQWFVTPTSVFLPPYLLQALFSAADKLLASGPNNTIKASPISPLNTPFKYSQGSAAYRDLVLRT
jgi:hypothetical protein